MRRIHWQVWLGLGLVILSAALHALHYLIFRDAHHVFIYLLGDIAFVPLSVLLVTLIISQLLTGREKRSIRRKLNMVVGAFHSEVGRELLKAFLALDPNRAALSPELRITAKWSPQDFARVSRRMRAYDTQPDLTPASLENLRAILGHRQGFLLGLLQNPNLLEYEAFTELLWAVFHVAEELSYRPDLTRLPEADVQHLRGDVRRAYGILIAQWVEYMGHLKQSYPYLFSLAVRTNPFDPDARVEVTAPA